MKKLLLAIALLVGCGSPELHDPSNSIDPASLNEAVDFRGMRVLGNSKERLVSTLVSLKPDITRDALQDKLNTLKYRTLITNEIVEGVLYTIVCPMDNYAEFKSLSIFDAVSPNILLSAD